MPSKEEPKLKIFEIFSEIQTRTNTKENLESFCEIFENNSIDEFNEILEKVFLIILYNYDKNTLPLKNIREFLKIFIERIVKNSNLKNKVKDFLNYFCTLFTSNAKKLKYKSLSIYFLTVFLNPYSNGSILLYEATTLQDIKTYLLQILKAKQTALLTNVIHLLDKHPTLQKDSDIWERLEGLLNGPNKGIKREIIKLFENSKENITKYLLDMYDDDSSEIRLFAFDKLCRINNFHSIDPRTKVKLFFVGLGDTHIKIQQSGKKLLKNYLNFLGIIKSKKGNLNEGEDNAMDIDDDLNQSSKKKIYEDEEDESNESITDTVQKKLLRVTSPMRPFGKKLTDSPSRVFDELDVIAYYNHPKYSYVFYLITEAMIDIIDKDDILEYCHNIIDNFTSIISKVGEIKKFSSSKKKRASFSSAGKERIDKYALFNDIYFLQNCINVLSQDKTNESFKTDIIDLLPDGATFSKILSHFYVSQPNIYILHQLMLIAQCMPFQDEIGNREMMNFIKRFISDMTLPNQLVTDFTFRRLNFNPNDIKGSPSDINNYQENLNEEKMNDLELNNALLPSFRRIILSMEDLIYFCLKMLGNIYSGKDSILFTTIMEVVSELKESVDIEADSQLKKRQKELIEMLKEKVSYIDQLEEKKESSNAQERIQIQKKLLNENNELNKIDSELLKLTQEEGNILYRITELCRFAINHCRLPQTAFDNMVKDLVIPSLKKKNFPNVVHKNLEITGLLAINHFNTPYKNFLKLFIDNLTKDEGIEFKESNRIALEIFFDAMLQNNLLLLSEEILDGSIDEKIQMIISKYLYHPDNIPRVIVFTGLCKLLMADRVTKHEFILSRLFVCLYKSFEIVDKSSEEYNIKIYEIMNNFMYFYSLKGKKNIYSVINAINVILSTQLLFSPETIYERTVISNYVDTKFDFLNQFLYIVYENSNEKGTLTFLDLIFKVFKFIYFVYVYMKEEEIDEFERKGGNDVPKGIEIGINLIKHLKGKIFKFFEKTNYDNGLLEYFKEREKFGKFFAFLFKLRKMDALSEFSENLEEYYKEFKEKNFKIEINGTLFNYSSEEKQNELLDYIEKKKKKYFTKIEEFYTFANQLKESKLKKIFKENSKILEAKEEEEEESVEDKAKEEDNDSKEDQEEEEEDDEMNKTSVKRRKGKKDKVGEKVRENRKPRSKRINPAKKGRGRKK